MKIARMTLHRFSSCSSTLVLLMLAGGLLQAGCASRPPLTGSPPAVTEQTVQSTAASSRVWRPAKQGGGYYRDDGPGAMIPSDEDLAAIPDAIPRPEPLHRFANRPYTVLNQSFQPLTTLGRYSATGVGSWYGRKFHGQKTSNGEVYDMFAMTAAHPTLPIPSYARVTNPANGRTVVVRVNDRGPFHGGRIIDLSYVAAWKLGYIDMGSTVLHVESLLPDGTSTGSASSAASPAVAAVAGPVLPESPGFPAGTDPMTAMIQRLETRQVAVNDELPEMRETAGIFLQLGAFGSAENAESFRLHCLEELAAAGLSPEDLPRLLRVQARAGFYRVQYGPWTSQVQAQQAAEQVARVFAVKPLIVRQ